MFFKNYDDALKTYNESKSFTTPPAGTYVAIVTAAKDTPGDPGKAYIAVTFRVEEGDHEGKRISNRFYYENPIGASKLIALATHAGLSPSASFDENQLIGKKVVIKVKDRIGNDGETRQEVHYTKQFDPEAAAPNQSVPGVPFA